MPGPARPAAKRRDDFFQIGAIMRLEVSAAHNDLLFRREIYFRARFRYPDEIDFGMPMRAASCSTHSLRDAGFIRSTLGQAARGVDGLI